MSTAVKRSPGPDQAAGWLIAFACFGINFICAGLARTAGVLYVALIELYGASREEATTPFSMRVCVRNMTGPLIGLLGLRYGIRAVTVTGGFVAALGSILCYFAPNIMWITAFWGVIHGFGFGLGTVIHMMMINQYFDKYKATALGLGFSGDCFGTFVFPLIMEYLLANFNVRETFLILGGIVLNVVPCAMLLRKPPWLRSKKKQNVSKNDPPRNGSKNSAIEVGGYRNDAFSNLEEDLAHSKNADKVEFDKEDLAHSKNADKEEFDKEELPSYQDTVSRHRLSSLKSELSSLNGSLRKKSEISDFIRDNMERHGSLPPVLEKETSSGNGFETVLLDDAPTSEEHKTGHHVQYSNSMKKTRTSSIGQMASDIVHRMRSASFASQVAQEGFIVNINQEQKEPDEDSGQPRKPSLDENGCCKRCGQEVVLSVSDLTTDGNEATPSHASFHVVQEQPKQTILQTLISTNTKPIFILISTSMAVYAFLFVGVLTIIIDYAVDLGVSHDQGKFLIIGFSVTDLIGRLSFGQVIDRKLVKMKNYSGVTMLLMGTLVCAIPFNKSFNYMLVCMCMYGFVQGGTAIMFPILVGQYMDKSEESVAMGCLNFYGGLLMLTMAPMIGYFRDNTGSYNWVFHIQGGMVAFIGIIWQLEPLIIKFQRKQQFKRAARIAMSKL